MSPNKGDLIAAPVVAELAEYIGQKESGSQTCLSLVQSGSEVKLQSPPPSLRQELLPGNCVPCLPFQHVDGIFTFLAWTREDICRTSVRGNSQPSDVSTAF
jgi:hypothetical protein